MAAPDFWSNQAEAQKVMQRRRRLEEDRTLRESLKRRAGDLGVLIEWAGAGEDVDADLERALDELAAGGRSRRNARRCSAASTIAPTPSSPSIPGAGGTESQDWAEMLLRMYLKWSERRGFKREVIDYQPGEEAGLKSVDVHCSSASTPSA